MSCKCLTQSLNISVQLQVVITFNVSNSLDPDRIFVKTVFFHGNMNKISFYKFFMVHYDYIIERYLCSMAFSAFTRYHSQFCSRSSPYIASVTKSSA